MSVAPLTFDPARLAEFAFGTTGGLPRHWDTSAEILRAVFKPNSRTAVKACHASSKTFSAADCVLLALLLGGDVLTTAPTWEQVEKVLWGQVGRTIRDGRIPLSEWGSVNQTAIKLPTGEIAVGLSTNEGVRFQGWHARDKAFLLVIFDEAPGVRPDIYGAVEGISAGGDVRHLLLGNPVIASGPFYDIFANETPGWSRYTIDAFDTPNLRGLSLDDLLGLDEDSLDRSERPYLVTRRWVRDRYREWGTDHPLWQSRVRGRFPDQSEDALLSGRWIEDAAARSLRSPVGEMGVVAGIDVAGPGEDQTVLALNRGGDIVHMQAWSEADPRAEVLRVLRGWAGRSLAVVNIDSVGIGWYAYCDIRDALEPLGVQVNPINVGEASDTKDELGNKRYANMKADLYWNAREKFANGDIRGLQWPEVRSQLRSLRYSTPRGVITIESKDDLRKRMGEGHSPDWAEALILSCWPGRADISALYGQGSVRMQQQQHRDWRQAIG